jgi:GTPase
MTRTTSPAARKKGSQQKGLPTAKLDELIEEATVDAHDESEQITGFYTMFEEHLAVPFKTVVLGVEVTVERVDMTDDEQIVAVCARGKSHQRIPITELPLPAPPPEGWEWIDAFRRWARGR